MRLKLLNLDFRPILPYFNQLIQINLGLFSNLDHLILCCHISQILGLRNVEEHTDSVVVVDPFEDGRFISYRVITI